MKKEINKFLYFYRFLATDKMNKKRPANMVVSAMLATIIFIIIANCFMNLWGNSFTTLTAAKTATQAQAYSDIVSEKIKLEGTDAEEVTTKTKLSEITGNDSDDDWFYTYEIENETEDDNGNVFKVASIKIYKDDENSPRYSTEIPLSSSSLLILFKYSVRVKISIALFLLFKNTIALNTVL